MSFFTPASELSWGEIESGAENKAGIPDESPLNGFYFDYTFTQKTKIKESNSTFRKNKTYTFLKINKEEYFEEYFKKFIERINYNTKITNTRISYFLTRKGYFDRENCRIMFWEN